MCVVVSVVVGVSYTPRGVDAVLLGRVRDTGFLVAGSSEVFPGLPFHSHKCVKGTSDDLSIAFIEFRGKALAAELLYSNI